MSSPKEDIQNQHNHINNNIKDFYDMKDATKQHIKQPH